MLEAMKTNNWASTYVQPENTLPRYGYGETPAASQKVNRRIEDIIVGDKQFDFTKPISVGFAAEASLPESGTQNDNG